MISKGVLDIIENEQLIERANTLGARLRARLEAMRARFPVIAEVRGPGAMVAVELMHGANPDPESARGIQARALERGLLLLTCGTYANVIRFLFPLTIQDEVFEEALTIFEASLAG